MTQPTAPRAGLLLAALLGALLGGCASTGADWAAATAHQPARALDETVPPPVTPSARALPPPVPPPRSTRPSPRTFPRGEIYAGVSASALPAVGPSFHLGQIFARTPVANWSFEMEATFQDLAADLGGVADDGSWAQVRGGVKAAFNPCGRGHPTARAGLGWFRATEATDLVEVADDYIAAHLGLGYEFDVTRQITTGPEVAAVVGTPEKSFDLVFVPQLRWHLIWKF